MRCIVIIIPMKILRFYVKESGAVLSYGWYWREARGWFRAGAAKNKNNASTKPHKAEFGFILSYLGIALARSLKRCRPNSVSSTYLARLSEEDLNEISPLAVNFLRAA